MPEPNQHTLDITNALKWYRLGGVRLEMSKPESAAMRAADKIVTLTQILKNPHPEWRKKQMEGKMSHKFLVPQLTLTMEKSLAIVRFDSASTLLGRYIGFVRIARANTVSWKSIAAIGYQLLKQRGLSTLRG